MELHAMNKDSYTLQTSIHYNNNFFNIFNIFLCYIPSVLGTVRKKEFTVFLRREVTSFSFAVENC